jgi:hypothetical protein
MTHTTNRVTAALTVAVALAAGASSASAAFVNTTPGGSAVRIPYTVPTPQPAAANTDQHGGAFDWGDAGIGAVGGIGITMIGVGGVLASTRRRERRPHTVTPLSS